jgi:hypothetical protein
MLGLPEDICAEAIGTAGRDVDDVPRLWKFPLAMTSSRSESIS